MKKIIVEENEQNKRIDSFLIEKLDFSRSKIQKMIKDNYILVNDKKTKNSYVLRKNDIIIVNDDYEEEMKVEAENIPLDIIYEDDDLIIVNKPKGMVVHPGNGNFNGTLVNALMHHSLELSTVNGEFRPGIVHRIDKDTSGLLMIAKNDFTHNALAQQLSLKETHRKYIALVWGVITNNTGTIDAPIGRDSKDRKKMAVTDVNSKNAVTHFTVLERYNNATLISCKLETGRTHQIRVHMNYIGHPVVNDPVYGSRKKINDKGQCLHAEEIGFIHPRTNKYMEFKVDCPKDFMDILDTFKA